MKSQASKKVTIQFMSKKEGDSRQQLVFETKKEAYDQLAEKLIPLTVTRGRHKWIVAAKSSSDPSKDARQVSTQELTSTDSYFYTQLVKGELDQLLVSPPVMGG